MKDPFRIDSYKDQFEGHSTIVHQLVLFWILVLEVSLTENGRISQAAAAIRIAYIELQVAVSAHSRWLP